MPSSRPWPAAELRRLSWLACLAFASAGPSSASPRQAASNPQVIPQANPQVIPQASPQAIAPSPAAAPRPTAGEVPQLARDQWKDCQFNLQTIGCRDQPLADGLRIIWKDGLRMDYRRPVRPLGGMPSQPTSPQVGQHPAQLGAALQGGADAAAAAQVQTILADRLGGLWRRQLLIQGNTLLTHLANGNRILVPLRFPCRPPLRGEVGYCH